VATDDDTLRVGLGSPTVPFSSVWRFWANQSDVYIATRSLAGIFKMSLHASGVWVVAFTKQSGAIFESNRRGKAWRRPPEFAPGWTMGLSICIPRLDDSRLANERQFDNKPIRWLPSPAVGNARWLTVVFSRHRDADPREALPDLAEDVGSLELADGGRVWVLSAERRLTDEEKKPVLDVRDPLKVGAQDPKQINFSSVLWITTSPSGPPMIVEIVLGPEDFYVVDPD